MKYIVGAAGRCVPFHPRAWSQAIYDFVRPEQVAPLLRTPRLAMVRAEQVAMYMRAFFAAQILTPFPDPDGCDLWRDPEQLLLDGGRGDCDDLTLFAFSLSLVDGYIEAEMVIGEVLTPEGWQGHAWLEGRDCDGGFLIEATTAAVIRGIRPAHYVVRYVFNVAA